MSENSNQAIIVRGTTVIDKESPAQHSQKIKPIVLDKSYQFEAFPDAEGTLLEISGETRGALKNSVSRAAIDEIMSYDIESINLNFQSKSEFLNELFEQTHGFMAVLRGSDHIFELANAAYYKLIARNDILGKSVIEVLPEVGAQGFLKLMDDVFSTGKPFRGKRIPILLKNGTEGLKQCYLDFIYQPLRDNQKQVTGIFIEGYDVTEQVLLEEKHIQLASIVEFSTDAIISKSLDGIITSWNNAARLMFGYTASEMIGQSISLLIPEDRSEEEPEILRRLRKGEQVTHFETQRITKDRHLLDLSLTISPIKDANGKIIGISKIARDITDQKKNEERKNDFIAMISHELKTPLTSIKAFVQILLGKAKLDNNTFTVNALTRTEVQVKKMVSMIGDFLNLARLEDGKMELHKEVFDLHTLIEEVVYDAQFITSVHTITQSNLHLEVYADRDKIGHVLNNLLTNAIKYSGNGSTIFIGCEEADGKVKVYVTDQGIGISLENQQKLFNRFYRVAGDFINTVSGFGIGLYLASEILKFHESKILVESELGKGSTFYFNLQV